MGATGRGATRRGTALAAALTLAAASVLALGSTSASAVPGTTATSTVMVTNLTVDKTQVWVRGEAVVPVTVSVQITDTDSPDGAVAAQSLCDYGPCLTYPYVTFRRVDGRPLSPLQAQRDQSLPGAVSMKLTAGNAQDGTFEGTVWITAAQAGDLTVGCVMTPAVGFDPIAPEGVCTSGSSLPSHPVITVHASNRPVLQVVTTPAVAPPTLTHFTVRVRLVEAATHEPIAHRLLRVCTPYGPNCYYTAGSPDPSGVPTTVTTDAHGYASVRMPFGASPQDAIVEPAPSGTVSTHPDPLFSAPAFLTVAAASVDPQVRLTLSATRTPASVALGSTVSISGKAGPCVRTPAIRCLPPRGRVVVQRWVSHRWSTVGSANIRTSARWSYTAHPSRRGPNIYRAWVPSTGCSDGRCLYLGKTTPALVVRVT